MGLAPSTDRTRSCPVRRRRSRWHHADFLIDRKATGVVRGTQPASDGWQEILDWRQRRCRASDQFQQILDASIHLCVAAIPAGTERVRFAGNTGNARGRDQFGERADHNSAYLQSELLLVQIFLQQAGASCAAVRRRVSRLIVSFMAFVPQSFADIANGSE